MNEKPRATKLVLKPRIEILNVDVKQFVWLAFLTVAVALLSWRAEGLADRIADLSLRVHCQQGEQNANQSSRTSPNPAP